MQNNTCKNDFETVKKILEDIRGKRYEEFDITEIPCEEISDQEKLCKHPVVSVITLAYRHEKFIVQTIASIVSQKADFEFELIIAEDHSPDKTLQIVLEYQKRYPNIIRILTWKENRGGCENFTRAVMRSRGKYIAFCEGDDFWCDDKKLQIQVDYLKSHPECSLVASDSNNYHMADGHTDKDVLNNKGFIKDAQFTTLSNFLSPRRFSISTNTVITKREIVVSFLKSRIGNLKLLLGDFAIQAEAVKYGIFKIFPQSLGTYRCNAPNSSIMSTTDYFFRLNFELDSLLISVHYLEEANDPLLFPIRYKFYADKMCSFCSFRLSKDTADKVRELFAILKVNLSLKQKIYLLIGSNRVIFLLAQAVRYIRDIRK